MGSGRLSAAAAGAGCVLMLGLLAGTSQAQAKREAPLGLDAQQGVRAELVGLMFTDEVVDGSRKMSISAERKGKYRLAVATIKITKPAGVKLTLACADLTLHYYHGEEAEVTPCEGMSSFSSTLDSDRDINLSQTNGPGFLKKVTSPRAAEAATVYVDALFASMEPDTKEAWIAVGQVSDRTRPFVSKGWTP